MAELGLRIWTLTIAQCTDSEYRKFLVRVFSDAIRLLLLQDQDLQLIINFPPIISHLCRHFFPLIFTPRCTESCTFSAPTNFRSEGEFFNTTFAKFHGEISKKCDVKRRQQGFWRVY